MCTHLCYKCDEHGDWSARLQFKSVVITGKSIRVEERTGNMISSKYFSNDSGMLDV